MSQARFNLIKYIKNEKKKTGRKKTTHRHGGQRQAQQSSNFVFIGLEIKIENIIQKHATNQYEIEKKITKCKDKIMRKEETRQTYSSHGCGQPW